MSPQSAPIPPNVMLKADGSPFPKKGDAVEFIKSAQLDDTKHLPLELPDGGWGILCPAPAPAAVQPAQTLMPAGADVMPTSSRPPSAAPSQWPYAWVILSGKRHQNETNYVPLTVNGSLMRLTRGVKLPLSASFIEALTQTEYTHYEQKPGMPYKVGTQVVSYPFTVIGPATKEEFENWVRRGTNTYNQEQQARASQAQLDAVRGGVMSAQAYTQ